MEFVTLAQARKHLLVDHDDDDTQIGELIIIASEVILNYLKQTPRTEFQSLPTPDPITGVVEWPFSWPWNSPVQTWWPRQLVSYQNLPPFVADSWTDSNGVATDALPGGIRQATLLVIGSLYDDREGATDPISPAVVSLLRRYRDPAMA